MIPNKNASQNVTHKSKPLGEIINSLQPEGAIRKLNNNSKNTIMSTKNYNGNMKRVLQIAAIVSFAIITFSQEAFSQAIVQGSSAGTKVSLVQGFTAQSVNLQEWNIMGGTALASISNTGAASFTGLSLTSALPVASGGTGAGTFTLNGVLFGNNTSALQVSAASTGANQVLTTAATGGVPGWNSLGAIGGITVSPGNTTSFLARWTSTGSPATLGNGITQDNGTSVGINNAPTATERLTVTGGTLSGINATSSGTYALQGVNTGTAGGTGVEGIAITAGTSGSNFGVVGIANNNTNLSIGVDGESTTANMDGVRGLFSGTAAGGAGVFANNTATTGGAINEYGVYAQVAGTAASASAQHIAVLANALDATLGTFSAALFAVNGETVITSDNILSGTNTGPFPRSWNGSIFVGANTATTTGGRIWFTAAGFNFYVSSTGSADYSEYFNTSDQSLGVGEVVALDPDNAGAVRRARPSDAASIVGVVSIGGTRLNDNHLGNRDQDPNSINVGMVGQVPVLVTTENGDIKPGDPLTLSSHFRGRATKAIGPCRIVGYATTHFPYSGGEKDYEEDINGGSQERLTADHVMCYLNVGWYAPVSNVEASDGVEPSPVESAHVMLARLNSTIVSSRKTELDQREAQLKASIEKQNSNQGMPATVSQSGHAVTTPTLQTAPKTTIVPNTPHN